MSLLIFISAISFTIWLFISGRWLLPTKRLKVGIAFQTSDPRSQQVVERAILKLKNELKLLNLSDKFRIFVIDYNLFEDNTKAIKYANKWDVNLIFHGLVNEGNYNSEFRCDLKDFSLTYRFYHMTADDRFRNLVENDLKFILVNREWIIDERNTFIGIESVSNNFVEIILSFLSITLCRSEKHPEISIKLIKSVIPYLEKHIPSDQKKLILDKVNKKFTGHLNLLRCIRLKSILNDCYVNTAFCYIKQKKYQKAYDIFKDGLLHCDDKHFCYNGLAYAAYFIFGPEKAEEYTIKMDQVKKNTLNYFLNMAFFSLLKKDYSRVIDYYDNARKKITSNDARLVKEVEGFLFDRLSESSYEIAYYYALGSINYCIDKGTGRKYLEKFITEASGAKYESMVRKAKSILKVKK
jgi:hypothetical protein